MPILKSFSDWNKRNIRTISLKLNKSLENYCEIEDQSELITKHRVIKSKEEIVYVKKAAELADQALDEAWKYTKAGVVKQKF